MLPFPVLFQDNHFIIIDKPAGMPVYSSKKGLVPSVETYFPLLTKRKDGPWLVHRLDQDTAGCLLIALRKRALIQAQACFANHTITKTYWAVVQGKPDQKSGVINTPILKHTKKHQWKMQADPDGQKTVTHWKVLKSNNEFSLLELHLLTGRTHQARIHCALLGHPIIGDPLYGNSNTSYNTGLHLLSRSLTLPLEPCVSATASVPNHMKPLLTHL